MSYKEDMREKIADLCHRQWSGWMAHLFRKSAINPDGTATIPEWAVKRWQRQIVTDYKDLSEEEKNSDREEADKFIALTGIDSTKRAVIIYDCHNCYDWAPGDTFGCGSVCGYTGDYPKIEEVGETAPIPTWCPRLKGNSYGDE